ncbi:MAG TPA: DUF932 domain-containing protein [Candidatus Dojkabacteria bacterium]|nr:DUF932 domain-containing protein [Candidatus Dojkabacteria bacterium]
MSNNVETMFSVRETPWHGVGNVLADYPKTVEEGLKAVGLDWEVKMVPLYYGEGNKLQTQKVETLMAITRVSDNQFFGATSPKYKILQNKQAFAFLDNLLDKEAKFETAGALGNGSRVWVLAKLEPYQILGDDIENYLLLSTSHDGTSAVRVNSTNIRVACANVLNIAFRNAMRSWKTKHMNAMGMEAKLLNASDALKLNNKYTQALTSFAEEAAQIKYTEQEVVDFAYKLFPGKPDMSKIEKDHIDYQREALITAMEADDLQNFKLTQWGVIQAVSDYAYHFNGVRKVKSPYETKMGDTLDGSKLLDRAVELLTA